MKGGRLSKQKQDIRDHVLRTGWVQAAGNACEQENSIVEKEGPVNMRRALHVATEKKLKTPLQFHFITALPLSSAQFR